MIIFRPIADTDIVYKYNKSNYPLVFEYLIDREYLGQDELRWFEIIDYENDDQDKLNYENGTVVGMICLFRNRILPNSINISVFEITEKLQGQGFGKASMLELIHIFDRTSVNVLTLQVRKPELANFYQKFGFKKTNFEGMPYFRRYYSRCIL